MKTLILTTSMLFVSFNAFAVMPDCEFSDDGFEIACTFTTPAEQEAAYQKYNLEGQNCWSKANQYGEVELYCFNNKQAFKTPTFASYKTAPSAQMIKRPEYR